MTPKGARLKVENGIAVDEMLLTSDHSISAIGDCAFYPSLHLPGMARLESIQNATDQARAVAARIMGQARAYDAIPWFWSIQGAARLQMAGLSKPNLDEVVRGGTAAQSFSVFLFDGSRLAAVESVNAPSDHRLARKLLAQNTLIDRDLAADLSANLRAFFAT